MAGLTRKDLDILKHYAKNENRELYWNYLAQKEGNDGYGLLALGVVRNDSMPGAIANIYAAGYAKEHSNRVLDERGWEMFGRDLIQQDFARRQHYFHKDHRPDLALNLPVKDVQEAHDVAFDNKEIDPNAWTPRLLLEAARNRDGERAAEEIWGAMLDNSALGLNRGYATTEKIVQYMGVARGGGYAFELAKTSAVAAHDRDNTDPDRIGAKSFYAQYATQEGAWYQINNTANTFVPPQRITDPKRIEELNNARVARLERQEKREQFHPDDPARVRGIATSPFTFADAGEVPQPAVLAAASQASSQASTLPIPAHLRDFRHAGHPLHGQYEQVLTAVHAMEDRTKVAHGPHSERLAAALTEQLSLQRLEPRPDWPFKRFQQLGEVALRDNAIVAIEHDDRFVGLPSGRELRLPVEQATARSVEQVVADWSRHKLPHLHQPQVALAEQAAPAIDPRTLSQHDWRRPDHARHGQYEDLRSRVADAYAQVGVPRTEAQLEQATAAVAVSMQRQQLTQADFVRLQPDAQGVVGPGSAIGVYQHDPAVHHRTAQAPAEAMQQAPDVSFQLVQQAAMQQAIEHQQREAQRAQQTCSRSGKAGQAVLRSHEPVAKLAYLPPTQGSGSLAAANRLAAQRNRRGLQS